MWPSSYKSFNGPCFLCFFLLFFSVCLQSCFAQEQVKQKKNNIFIEGFGAGGYYSLNYGRSLVEKKAYILSARLGLSTYHIRDFQDKFNPDLIIPLGLELSCGRQHQIVAGFGNTFTALVQTDDQTFEPSRYWNSSGYLSLGYRFRKTGSPYFFGLSYSPLLERYQSFRHWGALAIGRFL